MTRSEPEEQDDARRETASLRLGLYVPNGWAYGSVSAMIQMARAAEDAGWDSFFIWDQLFVDGDNPVVDAQVALAAIASATSPSRLRRLGALVTPLARRRAWKYARELVALQELSGGRMVAGFGLGIEEDYGVSTDELDTPRARAVALEDGLELLERIFSGSAFSWERPVRRSEVLGRGSRFASSGFTPRPMPQPPIWLAGTIQREAKQATAPFRRAARYQGLFPTAQPWDVAAPLTPGELARAVALTFPDGAVPDGFELVASGLTRGPLANVSSDDLLEYAEAGATTWLEAPPEHATVDEALEIIAAGPPSVAGVRRDAFSMDP